MEVGRILLSVVVVVLVILAAFSVMIRVFVNQLTAQGPEALRILKMLVSFLRTGRLPLPDPNLLNIKAEDLARAALNATSVEP